MTFKEKLQQEHPEDINEDGWCFKCPHHYGYEDRVGPCPIDGNGEKISCWECWNREIPEEVEKEVKKSRFITFTLLETGKKVSINPTQIEAVMEREDGAVIVYLNYDFSVLESYNVVMKMLEEGR